MTTISLISYHSTCDHGSYHVHATNDIDAVELAARMGVSGQLYRHYGYLDTNGIHHILDVREVLL